MREVEAECVEGASAYGQRLDTVDSALSASRKPKRLSTLVSLCHSAEKQIAATQRSCFFSGRRWSEIQGEFGEEDHDKASFVHDRVGVGNREPFPHQAISHSTSLSNGKRLDVSMPFTG